MVTVLWEINVSRQVTTVAQVIVVMQQILALVSQLVHANIVQWQPVY